MIDTPYLTVDEACVYLNYLNDDGRPNRNAFHKWRYRYKPRTFRLGRSLRFKKADLDAAAEVQNTHWHGRGRKSA
jgi:hypothetical protein